MAEAGYGKTTLLADWSRCTDRRTSWYRLDSEDRDWLTFIRHLVAGGREVAQDFAPRTFGLLHAVGPGGPTASELAGTLAVEMEEFGVSCGVGFTLLLDDYHAIDGFHETDAVVRALVDRTGPAFSIVISTRTTPRIGLARVRSRGGLKTLTEAELCFDVDETSRLFSEAYRRPLDEEVVSDLCAKTEGWPALLMLVRTSLEEHDNARALVAHLGAARGDMYEFLAEEVLAALSPELAFFLEHVSVLMAVEAPTASLVTGLDSSGVESFIAEAERLGLLTRPARDAPHRFHALVREFLESRLAADLGVERIRDLHRHVARAVAPTDWHAAAWHYLQAGEAEECQAVIDGAMDHILAKGDFEIVRPFLDGSGGDPDRPAGLVLRSKLEFGRGNLARSIRLAKRAVDAADMGEWAGLARLNLASVLGVGGFGDDAVEVARRAMALDLSESQRWVADGSMALWQASDDGDLEAIAEQLRQLAHKQEIAGQRRYSAISRLNLAGILLWTGDASEALDQGTRAETMLGGLGSLSVERAAATGIRASALAQLGRLDDARVAIQTAGVDNSPLAVDELACEAARLAVDFATEEETASALDRQDPARLSAGHLGLHLLQRGQLALRRDDVAAARAAVEALEQNRCADAAGRLRAQILRTRTSIRLNSRDVLADLSELERLARVQRSRPGTYLAELLAALAGQSHLDSAILHAEDDVVFCWSLVAEEVAGGLAQLSARAFERVRVECLRRPDRWRGALRLATARTGASDVHAASLLADIGNRSDASFLREQSAGRKSLRPHALAITKRLAERVFVEDLGAVDVRLGNELLPRGLRRKVLGLLCFLTSRPGMAASRDEALEALWGDLSPDAASNSLHQAIYFMRRVFEPEFREGLSAGYIAMDGDIVKLNGDLVGSASRECWRAIHAHARGEKTAAEELLRLYRGRYAMDFAYEEWAVGYRENLHAAVLSATESAISAARERGDAEEAIRLGQALLRVDPQADAIELELLKAYKSSGRHAAAAEQYAHYASFIRTELAADPPAYGEV